jgi:hypothetical protein
MVGNLERALRSLDFVRMSLGCSCLIMMWTLSLSYHWLSVNESGARSLRHNAIPGIENYAFYAYITQICCDVARILKGGRFLKNPGFSRSISKIFFWVADFYGQFQRFFTKGVRSRTTTPLPRPRPWSTKKSRGNDEFRISHGQKPCLYGSENSQ